MKIGITVNVGLNNVTSTLYSADPLEGCENDARAMFELAKARGFDMNLSKPPLLGAAATHANVTQRVVDAANVLKPGDLFFFSFAGHGRFKVLNTAEPGDVEDEKDKRDESIVLTDHYMTDNYWRKELWPKFKPGVRVIAIADCCHAETAVFSMQWDRALRAFAGAGIPGNVVPGAPAPFRAPGSWEPAPSRGQAGSPGFQLPRFRMMRIEQSGEELEKHKAFYDQQNAAPNQEIHATRLFLSACKDGETARDGAVNGAFTAALLRVWANGNFVGNYNELMEQVGAELVGTNQTPMLTQLGAPDVSLEKPFTIDEGQGGE
jgi:metacaspase-1